MHPPLVAVAVLAFVTVLPPTPGRAQSALEVCPVAARTSPSRPEARCVLDRISPLPPAVSSAGETRALPVLLQTTARSAYAVDRNDGVLWSGRGMNASLRGGVLLRRGRLTVALNPVLHWSENRPFPLPDTAAAGLSRFAYPWAPAGLDWFQRPGSGARAGLDPGDSYIEWDTGPVAFGVSTERLWWGPARRYPLLFSGTSGGFAHAYLRAADPIETPVGGFGAELLWGRLDESDWFDPDPRNDGRLLGALQVRWAPTLLPGLSLWYSLVRHEPLPGGSIPPGAFLDLVRGDPPESSPDHRGTPGGAAGVRLDLPDLGLEVYGEVGRGAFLLNPVPGVSDLHRSLTHLVGFTRAQASPTGSGWRVTGELMVQALQLPQPRPPSSATVRREPVGQGHSQRGQLLGAYVGPGSNAQYLAIERFTRARVLGLFVERVRRDDDAYYRLKVANYGFRGHDLEWTVGARSGGWLDLGGLDRTLGPVRLGAEAGASRRKNRSFVGLDGGVWRLRREWNFWGDLWLEWDPRLRSR